MANSQFRQPVRTPEGRKTMQPEDIEQNILMIGASTKTNFISSGYRRNKLICMHTLTTAKWNWVIELEAISILMEAHSNSSHWRGSRGLMFSLNSIRDCRYPSWKVLMIWQGTDLPGIDLELWQGLLFGIGVVQSMFLVRHRGKHWPVSGLSPGCNEFMYLQAQSYTKK